MGEEGQVVLAANDRHQDVVDGRKQVCHARAQPTGTAKLRSWLAAGG
jgi:hypothetical protein